jgi:anti-anti-sigma regulatory factor
MTAMAVETGLVASTRLADGLLVRLVGEVGAEQLTALRGTLLSDLPAGCRDVVIDAGEVADIDFEALAVLFAAWAWVEEQGGRFLLSRTSRGFEDALAEHGVVDDLPRLSELPSAPSAPVIPLQRGGKS